MKATFLFLLLTGMVGIHPTVIWPTDDPVLNPCKTKDGKDRPLPCEFHIHTIFFMGKNNEVLATSTANNQLLKLPMSKAVSKTGSTSGSLVYNVSIDYSRIHKASFTPPFYTLNMATGSDPISPGETSLVKKLEKVSPSLPQPFARANRVTFPLQLHYSSSSLGNDQSLYAPPQLFQLENPITFSKLTNTLHYMRDRAEAWRTVSLNVDFKK